MPTRNIVPLAFMGLLLSASPLAAQVQTPAAKSPIAPVGMSAPPASAAHGPTSLTPSQALTASTPDELLKKVIAQQVQQAEQLNRQHEVMKQQIELLRPKPWDKWLPAFFGLIGALLGSVVAFAMQRQRLRFDRRAARQAAGIKEVSEIKQFRSRQLNEFYAPIQALLKQGLVVRNELYGRLLAKEVEGATFSKIPDQIAAQGWSLGIQHVGNECKPFRLIDEMSFLQHAYPQLMGNVGETVRINSLIVKLVHEKVGLVLHENAELSQQLGIFLAHQSVLEDVYKSVTTQGTALALTPGYTTTFPRDLQRLVQVDCDKLRNELKDWQVEVSQWMKEMAKDSELS